MKAKRYATILCILGACVASSHAAAVSSTATWSSFTSTSATGDLSGVTISASTTASSEFLGFTNNHFGVGGVCGSWDGSMGLDHSDIGLIASNANGGDVHKFSFSSALTDGLFYIENFDSNSAAIITVHGATSVTLVDNSASIAYTSTGAGAGQLVTSNPGFNGEGDAALRFTGNVTGIEVAFSSGEGANGIIYTFAEPNAVPEPTSLLVMASLFALGGLVCARRKKQQA